jgi:hypothetical protein
MVILAEFSLHVQLVDLLLLGVHVTSLRRFQFHLLRCFVFECVCRCRADGDQEAL